MVPSGGRRGWSPGGGCAPLFSGAHRSCPHCTELFSSFQSLALELAKLFMVGIRKTVGIYLPVIFL